MATTLIQARKLLTAAELDLFAASRAPVLNAFTPVQLRGKLKRARTLRDKYRDLLQRQKLATRERAGNKQGRSGVANARTEQKEAVFAQMLDTFSRRLAQVEAALARAAEKAAAVEAKAKAKQVAAAKRPTHPVASTTRSPKAPAKAPRASKALGPTAERARVARHAMQPKMAGQQKVRAHVAARGRRTQAKRDSRR